MILQTQSEHRMPLSTHCWHPHAISTPPNTTLGMQKGIGKLWHDFENKE